jgi:Na+-transporting methylmalonyl-CoA/oxaloacetate decarboxylase gamma subunit
MTSTPPETDPNAAANEAVVARIRRISVVSFLVMILGVGSVLAVIVFRLMTVPAAGPLISGNVPAEAGRVVSAVAADKGLTITYQRDDGALIVIYDLRTLKETHRVTVGGPQVPRP